ncbi:MAG: sensor histidine kinase [Opitutaceae bacterium]
MDDFIATKPTVFSATALVPEVLPNRQSPLGLTVTFGLLRAARVACYLLLRHPMPASLSPRPTPSSSPLFESNHAMLLALSSLTLLATWFITQRLTDDGQMFRLALFFSGSLGYFLTCSGLFHSWYCRKGMLVYFVHQFVWLALIFCAGWSAGPIWIMALPLASQAVLLLSGGALWLTLLASIAAASLTLVELRGMQIFYGALNIFSSLFFTIGCSFAVRRENQTRTELQIAHEKLQLHAEKIEALAAAEERNRLAREIHDGVAHHLTAANVLLEAGQALLPSETPGTAREPLKKAQGQVRAALLELRESIESRHLHSVTLPLPERIRGLIAEGDFPAGLETVGEPRVLSPAAEQAFFRVAQEALTNASKHAPGTRAALRLDYTRAERTTLRVENPEFQAFESGDGAFGLLSLRQRMQQLGGTFSAGSELNGQFVVQAEIPA